MKALEVQKDIYWVGSLDYDIRTFDIIMHTDYGTTYNSYVVKGSEKNVLFEITKIGFWDEFYQRLSSVIAPDEIDYIVVNHTEPDHTGSLEKLLSLCKNATVLGTASALRFLKDIVNRPFPSKIIKDGDSISLGDKTLKFITAPFLHWPDTMFTYIPELKSIATCDFLGCHYCDKEVFNDKISGDFYDAYKYYFDNILGPFKPYVRDAIKKFEGLDINTVLNGHGPVIRTEVDKYIDYYKDWSADEKTSSIVMVYASAYGYTKELTDKIKEGINSRSPIEVKTYDITETDMDTILSDINKASGLLIGSPTLVGDTLPPFWQLLSHLNPNVNKGLIAGAYGSYGWSGEAVPNIMSRFSQLRFKTPLEGFKVCFKPSEIDLKTAFSYGVEFAKNF